jgi:hypothetical protein
MAGDRNGQAGPAEGYAAYDQGRQAADQDRYGARGDLEAVDPCAVHQRVTGLDCGPETGRGMRTDRRGETWSRSGAAEDLEAVDPCAAQYQLTGRGCEGRASGADRRSRRYDDGRGYARSDERVYEREEGGEGYRTGSRRIEDRQFQDERVVDVEEVDPCAEQHRLTGRGCAVMGYEQEGRGYADRPVWRGESYRFARPAYDVGYEDGGDVESCAVVHARMGERCPYQYQSRERIVEAETLPDTFFFSDGGVGGGIVDFGGGGGGGFAFSDSFAGANANASASAMASASANISANIMLRNHMMKMMHYPQKMPMHHGCGCKK